MPNARPDLTAVKFVRENIKKSDKDISSAAG